MDNWQEVSADFFQRWLSTHASDARSVLKKPLIMEEFGKWVGQVRRGGGWVGERVGGWVGGWVGAWAHPACAWADKAAEHALACPLPHKTHTRTRTHAEPDHR